RAELDTALVEDRAVGVPEPVAPEEGSVVTAGKEARFLALGARRHGEAGTSSLGSSLVLRLFAEREYDPVEERGIQPTEHVRLVLAGIGRASEQTPAAAIGDGCIVGRGEPGRSGALGERQQLGEAEAPVAANAGVRRLAAPVAAHERLDHGAAKLLA